MASKTLNFDTAIISLEGTESKETIGKILASVLAAQSKGDPLKFMSWAMDLYHGKDIVLDPTDLETLKIFVTGNEQMTNLLKYQILNILTSS